jgi:hypothetical protein
LTNIPNYGLLNPKPSGPAGYVTKDGMWAAVPFGKQFMIIHNGQQVHVTTNLVSAKSYINKQIKVTNKVKLSSSSLDAFL